MTFHNKKITSGHLMPFLFLERFAAPRNDGNDIAMTECDGTITSHLPFSNIFVKIPPVSIKAIDQIYLLLAASTFNLFLSTNRFFY